LDPVNVQKTEKSRRLSQPTSQTPKELTLVRTKLTLVRTNVDDSWKLDIGRDQRPETVEKRRWLHPTSEIPGKGTLIATNVCKPAENGRWLHPTSENRQKKDVDRDQRQKSLNLHKSHKNLV
jgi:hypothetical protein